MRLDLRIALFLITVCGVLAITGSPAFAETTCACDNGQQVSTTRDDDYACESACSMVGAESGVPAAVDESDDDDDGEVIVAPRRDRRRPGPARRR
jgi:hypothetical protein